jgi:hypothetical protein
VRDSVEYGLGPNNHVTIELSTLNILRNHTKKITTHRPLNIDINKNHHPQHFAPHPIVAQSKIAVGWDGIPLEVTFALEGGHWGLLGNHRSDGDLRLRKRCRSDDCRKYG